MKRYIKIISAGILVLNFTGCLKDDSTVLNPAQAVNVIEFANTSNLISPTSSKYPLLNANIVMNVHIDTRLCL